MGFFGVCLLRDALQIEVFLLKWTMMESEGGWSLMSVGFLEQLVFFLMHSYCRLGGGVRIPITPPVTRWQVS